MTDSVTEAVSGKCDESRIVLEATSVSKVYELDEIEVHALRGVDLQVCDGQMLSIMGPSGSGKSTLMHIVGLLDKPTEGHVSIDGIDVTEMTPNELAATRNQRIGFVFQSFNLLSRTSATANVELPLVYAGLMGGKRANKARTALENVGLGDRLGHLPNQLSGGQQQRVAIARALVTEPSIVLADEPTGNLDSRSGVEIMAILQELNKQGITIVVVTHDPNVAAYSERIVHVKDGRIELDEKVADRIVAQDRLAEMDAEDSA